MTKIFIDKMISGIGSNITQQMYVMNSSTFLTGAYYIRNCSRAGSKSFILPLGLEHRVPRRHLLNFLTTESQDDCLISKCPSVQGSLLDKLVIP